MFRIKQFLAMSGLTALEALRQPICLLLSASCLLVIAALPMAILYTFGEDGKQVRDSALACHFVFGLFLAAYAACSSLSREMRSGTASAILSKPVSRELFFLSKFAGLAAVILLFSVGAGAATLLSERVAEKFVITDQVAGWITDWGTGARLFAAPFVALAAAGVVNYRFKRPFTSTAFGFLLLSVAAAFFASGFFDRQGQPQAFDLIVQWRLVSASVLVTMALLVLVAVALALSTRMETVPTLVLCTGIFLLGLMSDYLFGRAAGTSAVCAALYRILPNWQHFWVTDALTAGGTIPGAYLLQTGAYAALYAGGVLCLGMFSFRHAEMK